MFDDVPFPWRSAYSFAEVLLPPGNPKSQVTYVLYVPTVKEAFKLWENATPTYQTSDPDQFSQYRANALMGGKTLVDDHLPADISDILSFVKVEQEKSAPLALLLRLPLATFMQLKHNFESK
ncbi:hypothetical protein J4227_00890 [Candidatus Woesearchaeota archaeon]|nr:hypothetical protein [Candidatus Woesearchaeota archaeon]